MAQAGFCSQCDSNVWVNEDGSCANGHPAECVSGTYETAPPPPKASRGKMPGWAIALIVVAVLFVVGVVMVGIVTAISVPVFVNASANAQKLSCFANERLVEGGAQLYLATNDGATLPSDWKSLMSVLIPGILKKTPTCPSGGTYTWDASTGQATCSIHGHYPKTAP